METNVKKKATSRDDDLSQAIAFFQAGKLGDAERCFKEVLRHQSKNVAALNLLSVLLTHQKRYIEAESYIKAVLEVNSSSDATFYNYGLILKALKRPSEALERFSQALSINATVAETWNNRGTVLNDLKRHDDAVVDFDKAIGLQPNYSEALYNRGKSLTALKRYEDAFAAYDRALALKPDLENAWLGRGNVFCDLKRYDEAFTAYDKALSLRPDLTEAWLGRGNVFYDLKRYDDAFAAYDRALALKPDLENAWLGRGNVFYDLKRYDDALAAYDRALALKPDLENAWLGRGNVFYDLKRCDEAVAAYDKALSLKPDLAEAWLGRGNVFYDLKRYDDAFAAYDRALALKPDLGGAWIGRGNVFNELRRYDDACAAYDRAVSLAPDTADAYWNKSLVKLCRGEFEEGWDLYERRSQIKENIVALADLKSLQMSTRQGRDVLVGKKIAILSEQGVGDELMFSSILPDLLTDAKSISYEVDPRLTRLFADAFPDVAFVPRDENRSYFREQIFDVVLQAGSLGYAYRRGAEFFPRVPYLRADPIRIDKWKAILAKEAGRRLKIGISWRGGTNKTRRDDRSIDLAQLAPLIQNDDRYFVSLQYGNVSDELATFNNVGAGKTVRCLLDDFDNFDDFAALVMALDLVISVQNTTVHMCGALGKTCWGMIPWRPEWRYGTDDHEMIWYSSVALYRQKTAGHWADMISLINSDLAKLLGGAK